MELGGNAPFIVLDDADISDAVAGAMLAKLRNGGAACTAANRFYVSRKVAKEFTEKLTEAMGKIKMAPGLSEGAQLGASVSIKERDKISDLVDASVKQGGKVLLGGAEAVQAALRVCRAFTGKKKIIKFEGHYHGGFR